MSRIQGDLEFSKNWENDEDFPTREYNETVVRENIQLLFDETKDYINDIVTPAVNDNMERIENMGGGGSVSHDQIGDQAVWENNIKNYAVTEYKYGNSSIPTTAFKDGSITSEKFNTASVNEYVEGRIAAKTDNLLSSSSTNPVQNKVVKAAIDGITPTQIGAQPHTSLLDSLGVDGRYFKIAIGLQEHWMLSFTVRLYSSYESKEIRISGYDWVSNTGGWYNPAAEIVSETNVSDCIVRFGTDSPGYCWVAIPIGRYAGVDVGDVVNAYHEVAYEDLFTITIEPSAPTGTGYVDIRAKQGRAEYLRDESTGSNISASYDLSGITAPSQITVWNGRQLRKASPYDVGRAVGLTTVDLGQIQLEGTYASISTWITSHFINNRWVYARVTPTGNSGPFGTSSFCIHANLSSANYGWGWLQSDAKVGVIYFRNRYGTYDWFPMFRDDSGTTSTLLSALPTWTTDPVDNTYLIRQDSSGTNSFGRVKFSTLFNYVKSKTSQLTNATQSAAGLLSAADKKKLDGVAANAEVNQNAFSAVKVGSTTVYADGKSDTLNLTAGANVTITPYASDDTITIAANDTTYSDATTSTHGLMSTSDKTKLNGISSSAKNVHYVKAVTLTANNGIQEYSWTLSALGVSSADEAGERLFINSIANNRNRHYTYSYISGNSFYVVLASDSTDTVQAKIVVFRID